MRIRSITVRNFRNLHDVTVPLRPGAVIVGENGAGKSNLLYALRLALDPTLPSSDRYLRREDFSDALAADKESYDPFTEGDAIEISVEFDRIGDDPKTLALLGASLVEEKPRRARIVYRFAPRDTAVESPRRQAYDWKILGGLPDNEEEVRGDLRRFLRVTLLSALRDVEDDIVYWRRSPLRSLLEAAAAELDDDALKGVADSVTTANQEVLDLEPIKQLTDAITQRTTALVGEDRASSTSFGVASTDPQRLLRTLRLFTDDAERPLSSASLGTLNVLYLALLQLSLTHEIQATEAAHVVLGIEEPEAHLHPHVQRLVFADVLRQPPGREQSIIVTTHSPHIVSVTPPRNLVILRPSHDGVKVGAAADAGLTDTEWEDIARYLDATRGELVFARRVLLVEGFAESVLIPKLAADSNMDLDKLGITVCAIHGTHFGTYARYLTALGIPWAVVTDGDPDDKGLAGERRALRLLKRLDLKGKPEEHGIFVGSDTFESDLATLNATNGQLAARVALNSQKWSDTTRNVIEVWEADGVSDTTRFLKVVEAIGKGRFAQRLASVEEPLTTPDYIAKALTRLIS